MTIDQLHTRHERAFEGNRFVYPVLSRRSGGLSVGINLNPDKVCNFDCIYCQVDRTTRSLTRFVELEALFQELRQMLALASSGEIFATPRFSAAPEELRRFNDIAFSGDGEPTSYTNFDEIVASCAGLKRQFQLSDVKLILITNATLFHRDHVQRGLQTMDANQGEVWAKLDAGTDEYYHLVDRTTIPFQRVLDNITAAAKQRPLVIQTLFMRIEGVAPSDAELDAYCDRLNEMQSAGGQLTLVQIHTVARPPAERYVTSLTRAEVDALVDRVKQQTGLAVEGYYGTA